MRFLRFATATLLAAALAAGCSPALDWREMRPEDSGLVLLLPCKPSSYARGVRLAGQTVQLSLLACGADGLTWGLAFADLGDPSRVSMAMGELKASAMANLGARTSTELPFGVAGVTPNPASAQLLISGQLPDGKKVQQQMVVFSKGTHVFQATAIGASLPADAMETFFGGLRLAP